MSYIPLRKAVERRGLHPHTLRKYADEGIIPSIRNAAGQRIFDVDSYLRVAAKPTVIGYCRVSSPKQRDDLERQIDRVRSAYPNADLIRDIGSGLNCKRKGLHALLERLMRGDKLTVVVTHYDRLTRFGVNLIRFLIERNGRQLVVLDPDVESRREAELTADLLAILHHFSCRMPGQRRHSVKEDTDLSDASARELVQTMVRHLQVRLQETVKHLSLPKEQRQRYWMGASKAILATLPE